LLSFLALFFLGFGGSVVVGGVVGAGGFDDVVAGGFVAGGFVVEVAGGVAGGVDDEL
jgi:hypothetical protein